MNNHKSIKRNFSGNKVSKKDSKVFNNLNKARFNLNDDVWFQSKDGTKLIKGKIVKKLKPNFQSRRSHRNDCYVVSFPGGKKSVKKSNLHRKTNCPCFKTAIKKDEKFAYLYDVCEYSRFHENEIFHNKFFKE